MAQCPDDTSVVDSTGELLAADTEKADLTDSYSKNYQNKIQARMTPKRTPAVSERALLLLLRRHPIRLNHRVHTVAIVG